MVLVDTSAWIEWLIDTPLADQVEASLPASDDWIMPTLVQMEAAKWLLREVGEDRADAVIGSSTFFQIVPLTTEIAIQAANVSLVHKLAMAEAVIYATAQEMGAEVLTCDAHFKDLPGVNYIPKA